MAAREGGSSQQPPRGKSHNHQSHEARTDGNSGKRKNMVATPPQTISVTEIKFVNVIRKRDWHLFFFFVVVVFNNGHRSRLHLWF